LRKAVSLYTFERFRLALVKNHA